MWIPPGSSRVLRKPTYRTPWSPKLLVGVYETLGATVGAVTRSGDSTTDRVVLDLDEEPWVALTAGYIEPLRTVPSKSRRTMEVPEVCCLLEGALEDLGIELPSKRVASAANPRTDHCNRRGEEMDVALTIHRGSGVDGSPNSRKAKKRLEWTAKGHRYLLELRSRAFPRTLEDVAASIQTRLK